MISKHILENIISKCLSKGGDFAEIYIEDTFKNSLDLVDGKIENAVSGREFGVGIRIFKDFKSVYAYTNDSSYNSLIEIAHKASCALSDSKNNLITDINLNLIERINCNIHPTLYTPSSIKNIKKVDMMKTAYKASKNFSNKIVQAAVGYGDTDQKILIANSDGLLTEDRRIRTRIYTCSIASDGFKNQAGTESLCKSMGFEMFDSIDIEHYAVEASKTATNLLHAINCPAGEMTVAIESGFGGIIFHEACGHSLEATSVAKGNSIFAEKLGQQIASTKVTAIDDGTIPNAYGSQNIDDEGNYSRKNILIENGILKGYLIDKLNGRRMSMNPTGNSRRESYKYSPTSRMTNTYIAPGDNSDKEIISSIENGLYVKKVGGGSVNPTTGNFNFAVTEGYLVKNGHIRDLVCGASLIGNGKEILMNIDMVGKKLKHGQGICGSPSGKVPIGIGQPLIRVSKITVGGKRED
ncbi:TldD/PmbA family protein [Clostridium sp. BL-8]|uniref:TldD/PmbA family protein n=1 Tax=Clostridium sp. BL-8 TaxID=349938 RepID=UPI00098CE0A0|nr:TldD/PmbA family protein [Clostridium sp. BL-8]OOM77117.1 metalloprotease TldD [Clostridium sp. BL-8]